MKRVVWIISEGSPGHVSQSEGLVAALSRRIDLECEVIQTRPVLNGFSRQLVRWWMGKRGLPLRLINHLLRCEIPSSKPDLIVASGGKAVFAARSLALISGAPLVFIGERKPYPSEWFHTVFTPSPLETGCHDVQIEMIPTVINQRIAETAASEWTEKPDGVLWAMVIGGSSASHHYTQEEWSSLARQMNLLAEKYRIRWLVATSRRTGAEAEDAIRRVLDPRYIAHAVWWAQKPEKLIAAILGAAEWVMVTQDSVTMVTEAVASGRPVVLVRPHKTCFPKGSFLPAYFERLAEQKLLYPLGISRLHDFEKNEVALLPRTESVQDQLASRLVASLKWSSHDKSTTRLSAQ